MNNKKNEVIKVIESNEDNILNLDYVKNYLRIDNEYDDEFLTEAIKTAVSFCEKTIGKYISNKKIKYDFTQALNTKTISFEKNDEKYDIDEVESIIINGYNVEETEYQIENGEIVFNNNITGRIVLVCNIKIEHIESDIKQALLFHIASIYQNKSGLCKVPDASMEIYNMNKKIRF